jgi:hypothetical protein
METSPTTYHWVAGSDAARSGAKALFSVVLRRRRLRTAFLVFVLAWALALWGTGSNAASALLFAFVWTALIVAATLTLLYLRARRRFARQLAPGLVLESEFGVNVVVLRGPETESRLTFSGIDRVQPSGDWVLLRQRRSRMTSCWPAALFPPAELARLQEAVSAGRP